VERAWFHRNRSSTVEYIDPAEKMWSRSMDGPSVYRGIGVTPIAYCAS
jgi:hypothetical protein